MESQLRNVFAGLNIIVLFIFTFLSFQGISAGQTQKTDIHVEIKATQEALRQFPYFQEKHVKIACSEQEKVRGFYCGFLFPGDFPVGGVPMRYIHDIEYGTLMAAKTLMREMDHDFTFQALVNINGNPVPVCSYMYSLQYDMLTPLYTVRY